MRLVIFLAGVAVIAASCNQTTSSSEENTHKPVPDALAENLKGKVQQVETESYLVDSATGQKGKLESRSVEKYDEEGYVSSYSNYTTKDSSTVLSNYDFNDNGYLTNITTTKNDKPLSSLKIMVDSSGKYILATSFDSTGKEDMYYDDIASNDYGQFLSAKGHHPDSTLKMTFTNNFDSIYYIGGDSKDSVGKLTYSSIIQLNEKKDPQQMDETTVTKDSSKKTTTTYVYANADDKGNWTQQATTENGKPKKIIIRTITYKQ